MPDNLKQDDALSGQDRIILDGVRTNGMPDLSISFPHRCFNIVTGVNGSGKTSLLPSTIAEESFRALLPAMSVNEQRRLARPFRSVVYEVSGLLPTVDISSTAKLLQKTAATLAEISGLDTSLKLLLDWLGVLCCDSDGAEMIACDLEAAISELSKLSEGVLLFAADFSGDSSNIAKVLEFLQPEGFNRFVIAGELVKVDTENLKASERRFAHATEIAAVIRTLALPVTDKTVFPRELQNCIQEVNSLGVQGASVYWTPKADGKKCLRKWELFSGYKCPKCASLWHASSAMPGTAVFRRYSGLSLNDLLKKNLTELTVLLREANLHSSREKRLTNHILEQLRCFDQLGLSYLSLERKPQTFSSGETIRLACALFAAKNCADTLFLCDEPSRDLHPRDLELIYHWAHLVISQGNTVIVADRHLGLIKKADHVTRLSLNDDYHLPTRQTPKHDTRNLNDLACAFADEKQFVFLKAKNIKLPLRQIVAFVGRSGSGKTRALTALAAEKNAYFIAADRCFASHSSAKQAEKKLLKQTLASESGMSQKLAQFFASLKTSALQGLNEKAFLLTSAIEKCSACQGLGFILEDYDFLGQNFSACEACNGERFSAKVLGVTFLSKNIAQVLELSVTQALSFFSLQTEFSNIMQSLQKVGLGHLKLGVSLAHLADSDISRIKLAKTLASKKIKNAILLLDNTLAGLDTSKLELIFHQFKQLVKSGASIFITTNDIRVINLADAVLEFSLDGSTKYFKKSRDYPLDHFSFLGEV